MLAPVQSKIVFTCELTKVLVKDLWEAGLKVVPTRILLNESKAPWKRPADFNNNYTLPPVSLLLFLSTPNSDEGATPFRKQTRQRPCLKAFFKVTL